MSARPSPRWRSLPRVKRSAINRLAWQSRARFQGDWLALRDALTQRVLAGATPEAALEQLLQAAPAA
jgi:hypothetical protein